MISESTLSPAPSGGLTFIEQLHAQSVQLCGNSGAPYMTGENQKEVVMIRGSCGLWSCPQCGARNARQWLARLLHHMNTTNNPRWYFLTITAHPAMRGQIASLKNLREGWKKLYNRMRRKYGISEYCKVWEFHEDGTMHLHLIIARKIGKKWLKDNSAACGMGYMCDSSASKNAGRIAGYVSKYLLKSFQHADKYPKGIRRIEVSRNWKKLPDLTDKDQYHWTINQTRAGQDRFVAHIKRERKVKDLRPTEK